MVLRIVTTQKFLLLKINFDFLVLEIKHNIKQKMGDGAEGSIPDLPTSVCTKS